MIEQKQRRQVVLDTETTGLSIADKHRIIEIGCVELINRRITGAKFHRYVNPERRIDVGALNIHGITSNFLADKPKFVDIAADFIQFIIGAELIIHNAVFDVAFLDYELSKINTKIRCVNDACLVLDTLKLARHKHPGKKNNLDALRKRYKINHLHREFHGALLDSEILANVYLAMTGGQISLPLIEEDFAQVNSGESKQKSTILRRKDLLVIAANETELIAHEEFLNLIQKISKNKCAWRSNDIDL
ncbi:MAG: DNA polymerase III subunit epsilon [Piscirickettsiaceae bacterium]|nr:DNA polymerase III subunit epsilon [Piscirickettsiaceae bacterium]